MVILQQTEVRQDQIIKLKLELMNRRLAGIEMFHDRTNPKVADNRRGDVRDHDRDLGRLQIAAKRFAMRRVATQRSRIELGDVG